MVEPFLFWASQGSCINERMGMKMIAKGNGLHICCYKGEPKQTQEELGKRRQEVWALYIYMYIKLFSLRVQLKEGCVMNT